VSAHALTKESLAKVPDDFPEIALVPDTARVMVIIDRTWERIKSAQLAGRPAAAAPDAFLLAGLFGELGQVPDAHLWPAGFQTQRAKAAAAAVDLELALRTGVDPTIAFRASAAACISCHTLFRDSR